MVPKATLFLGAVNFVSSLARPAIRLDSSKKPWDTASIWATALFLQ